MTKKFVKTFRVNNQGNKRLELLMEKLDMNLSDTINKLIADGIKKTRSEEKPIRKRKKEKEIKCPSRVYLEGIGYHCAEKPAKPKKLGDGSIEHANTLCKAHKEIIELIDKYELYKDFIEKNILRVNYCAHPFKSYADQFDYRFDGKHMDKGRVIYCPNLETHQPATYCTSIYRDSKCEYIRYLEVGRKEFISKIELMREKKK